MTATMKFSEPCSRASGLDSLCDASAESHERRSERARPAQIQPYSLNPQQPWELRFHRPVGAHRPRCEGPIY